MNLSFKMFSLLVCLIFLSCAENADPVITFGVDNCVSCNMVIDKPQEAAGLIVDSEFFPFCNPICMMSEVNRLKNGHKRPEKIYVSDYTTATLVEAKKATFFIGQINTVMNYGILAFQTEKDAHRLADQYTGEVLNFTLFRSRFENPDKTYHLTLDADGLHPRKILANKGDVLSIMIQNDLKNTNYLVIRGYDYFSSVKLSPESAQVTIKFIADKPGDGFPILLLNTNTVIGQLVVEGSHMEEESL